jgi:hypothetical protein
MSKLKKSSFEIGERYMYCLYEVTSVNRFNPFICNKLWDKTQTNLIIKITHLGKEIFYRIANSFIAVANSIYSLHHKVTICKFAKVDETKLAALDPKKRAMVEKFCFRTK